MVMSVFFDNLKIFLTEVAISQLNLNFWGNFCVPPLVTEVTISTYWHIYHSLESSWEHFLMVPLVFRFNHYWGRNAFSEFFAKKRVLNKLNQNQEKKCLKKCQSSVSKDEIFLHKMAAMYHKMAAMYHKMAAMYTHDGPLFVHKLRNDMHLKFYLVWVLMPNDRIPG
jgi:hypothetical protein